MLNLLLSLMVVSASVVDDCLCLCVDGREQTLCNSAESALQNPDLCLGELACLQPSTDRFLPELLDAPRLDVENCRTARVWQHEFEEHRIKRICDTMS